MKEGDGWSQGRYEGENGKVRGGGRGRGWAAKDKEYDALQDMVQAKVEYWESQERAMIE